VLGIWISETETARFWLSVMNELKNRGVKDILIICSDNLPGIETALCSAFPNSDVQVCIVHQIRNNLRYVSYKDKTTYLNDEALFKGIYLTVMEVTKRGTGKIKDWPSILAELSIYFEDRVGGYL
jgi:transposase-like protein